MIITRVLDMPFGCKGYVQEDEDGNYNVYINARYAHAQQKKTYVHELMHIAGHHISADASAVDVERLMK